MKNDEDIHQFLILCTLYFKYLVCISLHFSNSLKSFVKGKTDLFFNKQLILNPINCYFPSVELHDTLLLSNHKK